MVRKMLVGLAALVALSLGGCGGTRSRGVVPDGGAGTLTDAAAASDATDASTDAAPPSDATDASVDAAPARDTSDAPSAEASPTPDVPSAADARPATPSCQRFEDCAALGPRPLAGHCLSGSWSCLARRCVWECRSTSRTCDVDGGCVTCSDAPAVRTCRTEPCVVRTQPSGPAQVESTTCEQPGEGLAGCFGDWLGRGEGLCSVLALPTGALRWVISCGTCQTVLVQ